MKNDELPVNHEEHTRLKREFYDKIRQRSSNPLDEILLPFLSVPVVRPDGTVTRAEVVDQSGYRDRAYQDFALSARNAVLLSSPLTIPVGRYDLARDIVVEFDPKRLLP